MKNYILIFSFLLGCFSFNSCELDDYQEPNAEVSGQIIDAITGNPLQSEQPEGFQIRLLEEGYTDPNIFWGMADGNFMNTRLFPYTYTVMPTNGPFIDPEPQTVTLPKTGMTFTVQPYTNVSGTASIQGGIFNYSVNLKKGAGVKITELVIIVCENNPRVCMSTYSFRGIQNVSEISDDELVSMTHTGSINNYAPAAGRTYYVRFAAKTSSSARYNYSEPIRLTN